MPRLMNLIPTIAWKLRIQAPIAEEVDKRLFSPSLGKPAYGSRSDLVNELLDAWVKRTPLNPKAQEIFQKAKLEELAEL